MKIEKKSIGDFKAMLNQSCRIWPINGTDPIGASLLVGAISGIHMTAAIAINTDQQGLSIKCAYRRPMVMLAITINNAEERYNRRGSCAICDIVSEHGTGPILIHHMTARPNSIIKEI